MANPSKQKGTAAETALVRWLQANGYPDAHRQPLAGSKDIGDVWLKPFLIAEVKAHATWTDLDVDRWLDEAETERVNASADLCLLVLRRPGKADPAKWHLILRGAQCVVTYRLGEWVACYGR